MKSAENSENSKKLYEDTLREICSFGAGNAAARVSKLVDKKVTIELPKVWVSSASEGLDFLPEYEKEVVVGMNSVFEGEKKGVIYVLLDMISAKKMLKNLFNQEISKIGEMEESALLELSSIIASAVVSSLANFAEIKLMLEPPTLTIDLPLSIIDHAIAKQLELVKWIFFSVASITVEGEEVNILIAFFPFFDLVKEIWKKMKGAK
jgi:chemotaxis protein CheY-P-specific phosphatase CheC